VKRVIFHSGAELDLLSATSHYENQRKGLGREFRQEIEAAVARIRENPQGFPSHTEPGTRKSLVRRFPYTVFLRSWKTASGWWRSPTTSVGQGTGVAETRGETNACGDYSAGAAGFSRRFRAAFSHRKPTPRKGTR
jgi:toxin ParE1/3/4